MKAQTTKENKEEKEVSSAHAIGYDIKSKEM
jgi:hypothetical protein